jgi:DNA-binding response OmpR family regulator
MTGLDDYLMTRPPTAARPLLGQTVLVVDDSRYASDALRLLCLRSGARIRRADTLSAAHRHLRVYRPSVVIIDVGLPDGTGADLIAELAGAQPRVNVILGLSGDPTAEEAVRAAGADGFLLKPLTGLAAFQAAILAHLPAERRPSGPRLISDEAVAPDPLAFRDDLQTAALVLSDRGLAEVDYLTQFLGGIARSAGDGGLTRAIDAVVETRRDGGPLPTRLAELSALMQTRLAAAPPL